MNLKQVIVNWGFWGIVVGLAGAFIAIYSTFNKPTPNLEYRMISSTNVFDVHRELQELTILFEGADIEEKKLNLRIYLIRVENNGNTPIRKNDFYEIQWGVEIENGDIAGTPRVVNANDDFILNNIKPKVVNDRKILFNKIILEDDKFFEIEFVILHSKNAEPQITPIGKIIGQENFIFTEEAIDFEKDELNERKDYIELLTGIILILFAAIVYSLRITANYRKNIKKYQEDLLGTLHELKKSKASHLKVLKAQNKHLKDYKADLEETLEVKEKYVSLLNKLQGEQK